MDADKCDETNKQNDIIAGVGQDSAAEWHAREETRVLFKISKAIGLGLLRQGHEYPWAWLQ